MNIIFSTAPLLVVTTQAVLITLLIVLACVLVAVIVLFHRQSLRLQEEMDRAQKSESVKTTFLVHVSHSLRSPLNNILNYCNALEVMHSEQFQHHEHYNAVKNIRTHATRIQKFLNELLELSNYESSVPTLTAIEVNLAELVMSYRREIMHYVSDKTHVLIRTTLSPHCKVVLDTTLFRQLIMQVLHNAADHTEEGSITIRYDWENEGLRFWIEDTSEGLPDGMCEDLFTSKIDPYGEDKLEDKTMALRCSICKTITKTLHGKIEAMSSTQANGTGMTVTFWIPCEIMFK